MIGDMRSMMGVVLRDGHPVHGNDFKRLTLKLQVQIAVRGSVHETPELALARSDFNLRPYGPVHRHDFLWRLWLSTTSIRAKINALLQCSRVTVVRNRTATHNQDAFRQAG